MWDYELGRITRRRDALAPDQGGVRNVVGEPCTIGLTDRKSVMGKILNTVPGCCEAVRYRIELDRLTNTALLPLFRGGNFYLVITEDLLE